MKKHTIIILPSDFKKAQWLDNHNCPLARATKRYFKNDNIWMGGTLARLNHENGKTTNFNIEGNFSREDFDFVKAIKEPYPVVLIEC